jgi:HD superfamily phosphodiesterase
MRLISYALQYVIHTSRKYGIDESHSLGHSLAVFDYAKEIYNHSVYSMPHINVFSGGVKSSEEAHMAFSEKWCTGAQFDGKAIKHQYDVIACASILHDMCDKKYMDEKKGIREIGNYLAHYLPPHETNAVTSIIGTMSYSTVMKYGYPDLGIYQSAYHIVREADLLTSYDYNRCVIYKMMREQDPYDVAIKNADDLMKDRVLQYVCKNLFVTEYSKNKATLLHYNLIQYLHKHRGIQYSKIISVDE